ncbi:MAG: cell surface protein SprA [Fermentimonas sp.]|nr:cell surface protein SprA [Fermentimonas sp.]
MLNGSGDYVFPSESIIAKTLPNISDSLLIETSILPDTSALEPDDSLKYKSRLPDTNILESVDSIKYESRLLNNAVDLFFKQPINLYGPSNISTEVRYDYISNRYVFENRIGHEIIYTPFTMSSEEYREYRKREDQISFFRSRNSLLYQESDYSQRFSLPNRSSKKESLESIFGPGGVVVTTSGYIEVSAGIKRNVFNNPTLPQRARRKSIFNYDQDIDMTMNAKVGNKVNFDINYNSDASFDLDAKQIKLSYLGEEDDIVKNIEAGNVSMTITNSLINTGEALFGVKSDLQFGKMQINTIFSRQLSESKPFLNNEGPSTYTFQIEADQYDENRHFFLGHYFREAYENALSKLPYIQSRVSISRIEVWVTNKQGDYNQARNIVALADLGEYENIGNDLWYSQDEIEVTSNSANSMYEELTSTYSEVRNISNIENIFPSEMVSGQDYEKLENARLLNSNEYKFQTQLGYLSLNYPLNDDEVLAVAFEFIYDGDIYQVGEFTNNNNSNNNDLSEALFVKLLKPVSFSPYSYTWNLMMKNIYSLGYNVYEVQKDRFKLDVSYLSDTTGIYLNYIPDNNLGNEILLRTMNLDKLNSRNDPYPDGVFDFIEGFTIDSENGNIIFPVIEPFGSHLMDKIGNDEIAMKYVYKELYDSTLTIAQQFPEKNRFRISGEYRASSGSDFTSDMLLMSQTQRKTLMGVNFTYDISKNLSLGGTLMHYYEKPLIVKTVFGNEAVRNTMWGANLSYRKQSYTLTNLINLLPFVEATLPSEISVNLEFAQLLPGHYKNKYIGEYSYLDDFENSSSVIDIRNPYSWTLSSTPFNNSSTGLFPEAALSNNIEYGKNRAQLAWFYIDGIFTRRNSGLTPSHLKNDPDQLSDHRVREVYEREIFPNRDSYYGLPSTIPVLNISFYPDERGPYNLDTDINSEGRLLNPNNRWGGITRRMDTSDFEAANIEYIEFWLMDPFINDSSLINPGGDLYFNLGNISEDILKDGKKFFENGLPVNGDTTVVGNTVWGKYPKRQSTVYAFDNSGGIDSRRLQDVGFNGLNSEEEKQFPAYFNYIEEIKNIVSAETISNMEIDNHSPLNDPAGDNFRHYRGTPQDRMRLSILDRYKYFNGSEGNSLEAEEDKFSGASRTTPDIEDINNDNTLNESESYYQYKISLRPGAMEVGSNYIVDSREATVRLRNGSDSKVKWYQFKIPIREYESRIGNIRGFNNIRFIRMFLTGFNEPIFLRFATMELVRSDWRTFSRDLITGGEINGTGEIDISTVNIEENGSRSPVNYVIPPGVSRIIDPGQPQLRKENEQSLSIKISNLEPGDTRSVFKNSAYDLRRYKKLQMFVHAEKLVDDPTTPEDGDLTIFIRLGSDYRNNYYEYEIPLKITPEGQYSTNSNTDREIVWPKENLLNLSLDLLTSLKLNRNKEELLGTFKDKSNRFRRQDPEKPDNSVSIIGNPSLADVKVIMIGIRNSSNGSRSAEIWVNELRLTEFDDNSGWAAQTNVNLALSDIGNINFSGRKETAGYGALNHGLLERRNDDFNSYNISLNFELGRFLPKQIKLSAPFYYNYSNQLSTPLYDPFNTDLLLKETSGLSNDQRYNDSIRSIAVSKWTNKSISLSNVKMDIKSKNPMPHDPANLSFTYAHNLSSRHSPNTEYESIKDWRFKAEYEYSPKVIPWEPFRKIKNDFGIFKIINFNFMPDNIRFSSDINRYYQEIQLKEISEYSSNEFLSNQKYLTFSSSFFWKRNFNINWNITRNLLFSLRSGTLSEIEEPYLQVNKKINRNDYDIWKDSIVSSIANLGKPLNYEQLTNLTYTFPFAQIAPLSWINSSAVYSSLYKWERGAYITDETIGNYIYNDLSLALNSRFNFASIYNKIPIKSINMNLSLKRRTDVPGYIPLIGDFLGQNGDESSMKPGLGFALGINGGKEFIERSLAKNLLVINKDNLNPAMFNKTMNLRLDASIEPFRGLNINLSMLYEDNKRNEIYYMLDGMPNRIGGSFAMTTVSLFSAFENSKTENNYYSSTFEKFLNTREIISERILNQYSEIIGTNSINLNSEIINRNSADVLIPAFLAAYTGRSSKNIGLTPFPDIKSLLPNWEITYNLISLFPDLQNLVQSFSLNHRYLSQYRVGSYSSFQSWESYNNDNTLGYVTDHTTGSIFQSSPFNIPSVSITESFNPLIEAQTAFYNNMNVRFRINKTRGINLNIASFQMVETSDNDIEVGLGYKYKDFNIKIDISRKTTSALIRKIEDGFTQATTGLRTSSFRFSTDYSLSKRLILKGFYDFYMHRPLVSSYSYPTSNSIAGLSIRLNLND